MAKQPPFAVLFDMDGVLLDTMPASIHARKTLAPTYGFTSEEMKQHSKPGRSLRDFYLTLQKFRPFDADFDSFADSMLKEVFAYLEKHSRDTDPALTTFLKELQAHHIPIAVGTSALKRSAHHKLALVNLKDSFDVIITADDVERHKPHPDIYLEAARHLNVDPSRCVVVEDAVDGIDAGKAAGMKVIGFSKYVTDVENLKKADLIVDDFSKLDYQTLQQLVTGKSV